MQRIRGFPTTMHYINRHYLSVYHCASSTQNFGTVSV